MKIFSGVSDAKEKVFDIDMIDNIYLYSYWCALRTCSLNWNILIKKMNHVMYFELFFYREIGH